MSKTGRTSIIQSWPTTMPPKNKAKAAGVSASSFFDLKAEIAKQEAEFAKSKAAGKSTARVQKAEKASSKEFSTRLKA